MKTVVSKGEFARLKNRVPSAVSNWIAEGKISREALIGEGNRARIWVERADADLARSLDPVQQAAQDLPILGPALVAPPMAAPSTGGEVVPFPGAMHAQHQADAPEPAAAMDDIGRRRRADADRAEHDAEQARRRLSIDEGRWIEAEAAQRAWSREMSGVLSGIETFVSNTLAREIADRYGLDWKKLSVEARTAFRRHRAQAAAAALAPPVEMEAAE